MQKFVFIAESQVILKTFVWGWGVHMYIVVGFTLIHLADSDVRLIPYS